MSHCGKYALLFLPFWLYSCALCSQVPDFYYDYQVLDFNDGLASDKVLCGFQDQRGLLWFGTRDGLQRYDGTRFTLMTKRDGLQSNHIVKLGQDKSGKIWISYGYLEGSSKTNGKTDIYDPVTEVVQSISLQFPDLPFAEEKVSMLVSTSANDIYLAVQDSLFYSYHPDAGFRLVFQSAKPLYEWNFNASSSGPVIIGDTIAVNAGCFIHG